MHGVLGRYPEKSPGDAGVVDQNVEPAVVGIEVVVSALIVGLLGDVELKDLGINACGTQFGEGLFALLEIARADYDLDAVLLQIECGLKSKAAVATGDECDFLSHT